MPAILPYFTNQSCFSGFHLPPAALACWRACISATLICRGTRVSAVYRGGGGDHSSFSTINSTVFSLCRDAASYLKRTHSRASPYFFDRLFVPRCPGFKISRVFTQPSVNNGACFTPGVRHAAFSSCMPDWSNQFAFDHCLPPYAIFSSFRIFSATHCRTRV